MGTHHVPPLPDGSDDESYSTVDKNDPTHEQYKNEQRQPRKDPPVPEVHSPPKGARATNSTQKESSAEDIMDIHKRLYTQYVPNYAAKIAANAMAIDPTPQSPNRHNPNSQDTDSSAWTVQTGAHLTPAESQALLQNQTLLYRLNKSKPSTTKPTPPRSAT